MPVTAQETSISKQLRALIRLQHIDNRIDQIKKLRGDLPEEIEDLEDEKAGLETRLQKYEREEEEQQSAAKQADIDIKEAESMIKKYEDQQLQVRNNREYDALTKEIETQKERIADARATIENAENPADTHAAAIEETKERLAELTALLDEKKTELDEVLEDTKHAQEQLETTRGDAEEEVDDRYVRAYNRLRNRLRDGRAVVPLERGAAAGFAVPPQRQVEIRQRKRIIVSEHDGRVIVDKDLYEEVVDNMEV